MQVSKKQKGRKTVLERELAVCLAREVTEYFRDPEHRKKFEEWYLKKYGESYDWKNPTDRRKGKELIT